MTTVTLKGRTSTLRDARRRAEKFVVPLQALSGRLRYFLPIPRRFTGAYFLGADEANGDGVQHSAVVGSLPFARAFQERR